MFCFQVADWIDYDFTSNRNTSSDLDSSSESNSDDDTHPYVIRLYGRTHLNDPVNPDKSCCLELVGFTPFFFIPLGLKLAKDKIRLDKFVKDLKRAVPRHENSFIGYKVRQKINFDGFTNNTKMPFLQMAFSTPSAMRAFTYRCKNVMKRHGFPKQMQRLYESNIPAILDCMHLCKVKSCGWVQVNPKHLTKTNNTRCDLEFSCHWSKISSNNEMIERGEVARWRILSFDIECQSVDGSFPQAHRYSNYITKIGCTFNYYQDTNCYNRTLISVDTCDDIDDVNVIVVDKEQDALLAFTRLVQKMDPDVITGYNIFGFDYKYMYDRLEHCDEWVENDFLELGRNRGPCKFTSKDFSSSARGSFTSYYMEMQGRITIDLMMQIQADDKSLSNYKLDSVASHYNQDVITNIQHTEDSSSFETPDATKASGIEEHAYLKLINIDDISGVQVDVTMSECQDPMKFKIVRIEGSRVHVEPRIPSLVGSLKWSLAKDDLAPKTMFKYETIDAKHRAIVGRYCVKDCVLVNLLMEKLDVLTTTMAMSNICHVPLSYVIFRGQGIKSFSLVAEQCKRDSYVIPAISKKDFEHIESNYGGAAVLDTDANFYTDPVAVLDYGSLYPSCMIACNMSWETMVKNPQYDNLETHDYIDVQHVDNDGSTIITRYARCKSGDLGIIPKIESNLLRERKATRQKIKTLDDPFKKRVFNGHQLAIKITANSLYGQLGAQTSPIYNKPIAAGICAEGKRMLNHAATFMEETFMTVARDNPKFQEITKEYEINPQVVYGDTDSVFVKYNLEKNGTPQRDKKALQTTIDLSVIAEELIPLNYPHKLEYEKTFWPFAILTKKRYVGNKYEFDINKFSQTSMGLVTKRRDNSKMVKKVCGGIIKMLMSQESQDVIRKYVSDTLDNIVKGNFNIGYFVTSKTLKPISEYKNPKGVAHAALAMRMIKRDPGNAPKSNDRIQYVQVIRANAPKNAKQGDLIEELNYVREHNLKIDYMYYIERQIMNPACDFLNLVIPYAKEELFDPVLKKEDSKKQGIKDIKLMMARLGL
uniref:DNA polymerase n=1 Tax=Megaviridae environmental sample TaxID=1737588 RepID=A0A5J6VIZ9_9VIRU|nr:MAG: DNA polymerase family B [Megaviridae environmental sample]